MNALLAMAATQEQAVSPTHLLLAEDDEDMRSMLASVMRRDGYVVTEARDGEELIAIALDLMDGQGRKLDLIVSDIRMPGHTGLDVLRLLRGFGWDIPIILITAFGDLGTHRAAEQNGVHAVLDKPFELDDLRTLLLHFAPPR